MTENDAPPNPPMAALRQKAEKKLNAAEAQSQAKMSSKDMRRVFHELQVHQIELELQNEELRRTQTELEASQARYFDLYDLAPVGYVTLSEPGLILEANLTAAGLLGVEHRALVRQPLTRFILPEDQDIYYQPRKQLFESGTPQACELRLRRPDDLFFWARLEMTTAPTSDGTPIGRVVISDITARVRSEQEQQRAEAELVQLNESLEQRIAERTAQLATANRELRGEMAARRHIEAALRASEASYRELAAENARLLEVSQAEAATKATLLHEVNHRVKNNLAAIIGLLYVEQQYLRAKDQATYQTLVQDLMGRIHSLAVVHAMLSAATWAPISLTDLAERVMRAAQAILPRQSSMQVDVSPSPVRLAPKQANALSLILNELAANTLKYALRETGPTQLSVQVSQTAGEISLEYRDNGPGFPDEVLRGDQRGVGLYLIKTLAEGDLEGAVTFGNDHGAIVRLRFSAAADD